MASLVEKKLPILKKLNIYLTLVTFGANLIIFSCYLCSTWMSPSLAKLTASDSMLSITDDEAAWLINCFIFGTLLSPLPTLLIMDRFQRKTALFITAIPLLCGWILTATAESIISLYIGRLLHGIGFGMCHSIMPHYLTEIATTNTRGIMSAVMIVIGKFGSLFTYAIGPYVSISTFAWIALFPLITSMVVTIFIPESPYHLLTKGLDDLAIKNLKKLRQHTDVKTEVEDLKKTIDLSKYENRGSLTELFGRKYRRCFMIIILLAVSQQCAGVITVIAYAETIFMEVGGSINSSEASILFGFALFISSVSCLFLMDKYGRRTLLMVSLTGLIVCNGCIGGYFQMGRYMDENMLDDYAWIALIAMIAYTVFYCLGIASIPYVILGEIFPKHLKAIASSVYLLMSSVLAMITVKCFQIISTMYGRDAGFLSFAGASLCMLPLYYFFIPETRGKTLFQIQEEMNFEITYL